MPLLCTVKGQFVAIKKFGSFPFKIILAILRPIFVILSPGIVNIVNNIVGLNFSFINCMN